MIHRFLYVACISTKVAIVLSASLAFTPIHLHHRQDNHNGDATPLFASAITDTRGGGGDGDSGGGGSITDDSTINDIAAAVSEPSPSSKLESLLAEAQCFLRDKNADGAFDALARAFRVDPTSPRVSAMFESCLGLKVELAEEKYYQWKDGLESGIDDCMRSMLSENELNGLFQDRMGLSSLFIDRELYDEAGVQLRKAIEEATFWLNHSLQQSPHQHGGNSFCTDFSSSRFKHWQPQIDRALYLLYRTNAACCHWDSYFEDGDRLRQSLTHGTASQPSGDQDVVRLLHPFDALKFPCISLELASDIARSYASRALESVGVNADEYASQKQNNINKRKVVMASRHDPIHLQRKIRIGYISPDFTSRHPLAFLMQHVFRCHDKSRFSINIYSLSSSSKSDDGPEVQAIRESSDQFTILSPSSMSPIEMYRRIMEDELDILVDLCGYAGTSIVSEIIASRCRLRQDGYLDGSDERRFPIHVSYMGFPGTVGSSAVWDYSVFDRVVVPPDDKHGIRRHYEEALVYMPHCYFVNSHKSAVEGKGDGIMVSDNKDQESLRVKYGLHPSAFVFCCHSRPDKIDPSTFRSWMRALSRVLPIQQNGDKITTTAKGNRAAPSAVLWLLRSGEEMEQNLRRMAREEFGEDMEKCLVFADIVDRKEHLRRLEIADVFLDTPAYNAHTLGVDALYAGVPMISLLREFEQTDADHIVSPKSTLRSADINPNVNEAEPGHEMRSIATNKLASRVGASLLRAVGLDDLIYHDMTQYEDAMVRCVLDGKWLGKVRQRLISSKDSSPLFDTERWVGNLEAAFVKMFKLESDGDPKHPHPDILLNDM